LLASALVNTMQQVGGSIGIALLSTFSATAATSFGAVDGALRSWRLGGLHDEHPRSRGRQGHLAHRAELMASRRLVVSRGGVGGAARRSMHSGRAKKHCVGVLNRSS
jgi:hypothetical protein